MRLVEILEKIRDQTSYTEQIKGQKVEDREGDAHIIYEWFQTTVNSDNYGTHRGHN